MTNLIQHVVVCVVVTATVVLSQNVPPPRGNVGNFRCPQERGQFEDPSSCTRFYQCDGGVASLIYCPPQLIFNPAPGKGYCDWPHLSSNPSCARGNSPLTPQASDICSNNPGNPTEAFIVGHTGVCNAFYTCSSAYLYAPCTFCPETMYFNLQIGACRSYVEEGRDPDSACEGRQFVQHVDKVYRQLDGTCWPYSNLANPFQPLLDAIRNGPRPTPGPLRPG